MIGSPRLTGRRLFPAIAPDGGTEPIRSPIYSLERLEEHAESLAHEHRLMREPRLGRGLSRRLKENAQALLEAYRTVVAAVQDNLVITPAAEWLADNFYVVDEQLRQIQEDLPNGFYRRLPKLEAGFLAGYPRVFALAWAFVAHTDSRFDPALLEHFVRAYQRIQPLSIGELWALPITLRVVLVENLRRLTERVVLARNERQEADLIANGLLGLDQGTLTTQIIDSSNSFSEIKRRYAKRLLPRAFSVQLAQRLREEPKLFGAMRWLEERLERQGTTIDEAVNLEHQLQAAANVSVRNVITSMRLISAFDWAKFFEGVSLVDEILRQNSVFADSDFATRDRYRHAVEELAQGSKHSELEVARLTMTQVEEARASRLSASLPAADDVSEDITPDRHEDPGYYLISKGRAAFEKTLGFRAPWQRRVFQAYIGAALPGYLGTIGLIVALVLAVGLTAAQHASLTALILLGLAALIPASELSIALLNAYVIASFPPRRLPKLELKNGIPAHLKTMVVVPTLLGNEAGVREEIERLEVRYLANSEGCLHFALLTDFTDAPIKTMPGDELLLHTAFEGIRQLNMRYGSIGGESRFLLYHRERIWVASEETWMGWERKRGKLHELNRLLRGATNTSFIQYADTPLEIPSNVRFVITLDADTKLPRGAASKLVGAMAHPLNRPLLEPHSQRVIGGYAVLQPRITMSLPSERQGTIFQQVFSSHAGMDPYSSAVSDVYQDLFNEGSYTGKGIYDLDAFESALKGRVPETTLLSHDLFEGLFARAGLLSDVELVEEYPDHYEVHTARQHRWARGDWQLLPWILSARAPIPLIGRWKMVDNLRRSLLPVTSVIALTAGWVISGVSAFGWSAFIVGVLAFPAMMPFLAALAPPRTGVSRRSYFLAVGEAARLVAWQAVLTVTLLAHQAWLMTDASLRTLIRLLLTRRNLLEWRTAAQASAGASLELEGFYRRMGGGLLIALISISLVLVLRPASWLVALPIVLLWLASPFVARLISLPQGKTPLETLSTGDRLRLRLIARRTWRYFERFVGIEDHFLPPDNFQETPRPVVAHRTSPTNIGLALISTVCAHDLGWLGVLDMTDQLEATLNTTLGLEKFRGHLYNWYDTQSLRPLEPLYVSSVDSGNLAGHLIALAQACHGLRSQPLLGRSFEGIFDAVRLVRGAAKQVPEGRGSQTVGRRALETAIDALEASLNDTPATTHDWLARLELLKNQANTLVDIVHTIEGENPSSTISELLYWSNAARASIQSHLHDLETLLPWAKLQSSVQLEQKKPLPSALEIPERGEEILVASSDAGLTADFSHQAFDAVEKGTSASRDLIERLESIAAKSEALVEAMGFGFLFDETRKLFSIGYNVAGQQLDPSFYDLLASEARLTSFLAIAKGEVPTSHWFHLGRELTPIERGTALVSWSGSMFEYLMPALVLRSPAGSLLAETQRLIVRRQISYGAARGVPWGISESAYAARDLEFTYQYSSFGVPGLGLKRGLGDDLVIAPYATALAAMIEPVAAVQNLGKLETLGASGSYGFYDALDFTGSRLPEGQRFVLVKNVMVHHQGMALVALANVLLDDLMVQRFHSDARVQSAELLLQERTPRDAMVARPRGEEVAASIHARDLAPPAERLFTSARSLVPQTHLLSNGRYTVMLSAAGSGFSRWNDLAVTRWREDTTRDASGTYIYLRDVPIGTKSPERGGNGRVWSVTPQPTELEPEQFEARFFEDHAEFFRRDAGLETRLEVIVSTEDDAELRRVSLANLGSKPREIELTSYLEIVLASPAADLAHPAFSKLFVQTEFVPHSGVLLATRRARSSEETSIWAAHVVAVEGGAFSQDLAQSGGIQFETDRARFLERGHDVRSPASVADGRPLSGTAGAVLDPIFSLRRRVSLAPGARVRVTFTTLIAPSREAALELADKYRDPAIFERESTLSWTHAQVGLHHLGIASDEAHVFQRLAGHTLYLDPSLRPPAEVLERNVLPQSALWKHGISGDLPIVLVRIDDTDDLEIVRQAVRAHGYWRTKHHAVDLVILNEQPTSYVQELQNAVLELTRIELSGLGGVFVLRADLLSNTERDQLRAVSRAVLSSRQGTLAEQVARGRSIPPESRPSSLLPRRSSVVTTPVFSRPQLEFENGLGGFSGHAREYVIVLGEGQWTPVPWVNVIANAGFGFVATEAGSGYTWAGNSRENKITHWSNDPVSDPASEAIYVRDEETLEVFTATALPIREASGQYIIRHGQGYSIFEHETHGLRLELSQFVPVNDPVKISKLVLENQSNRPRRLSITGYLEWVLGVSREASVINVLTELDPQTGAILARNPWNSEFATHVAFADLGGRQTAWTTSRTEFIGRNGSLERPAALEPGARFSNRSESGLEPCAALQTTLELAVGARVEIVFTVGQAESSEAAIALILKTRASNLETVLNDVKRQWDDTLGTVQVHTPDRSMDIMLNRWLLYQTLSSRVWGRSGFYQAGGAYGFRDQLQDIMALNLARPDLAREQIVRASSRQFLEGDVQHWWHPPSGRGVRTHISDDLIWLPYAITHYLEVTNDLRILEETTPFLDGPVLALEVEDSYFTPQISDRSATVFEHAARALDHSLKVGTHGLPLIGSGDWNDGFNRVGREGKGESVWLAWFLHINLSAWVKLAESRQELTRAATWRTHITALETALETQAWDGDWYKRGFFDDGTPLGSAQNQECRIDAIAQSWAVISGAAPPQHAAQAMASLEQFLVKRGDGLVLLFTPPFDHSDHDPGYIKGYLPGVRENGGQYTHAAVWSVIGFAALGNGDKASELFSIINPINHSSNRSGAQRYKVEPYVVAADVYAVSPHVGRGGWTWYTGSSGWLYRAGLEWILGFRIVHGRISINPCIPRNWTDYQIEFKYHSTLYQIEVENPHGVSSGVTLLELDGHNCPDTSSLALVDDGQVHQVRVVLG